MPDSPLAPSIGLSPRMRGNHEPVLVDGVVGGSIPAYAGEPRAPGPARHNPRVYPRVCGGTKIMVVDVACWWGLSPRMRGNLSVQNSTNQNPGSIPAYAGEPRPPRWRQSMLPVYPRVCGGTMRNVRQAILGQGLSPRMRGNLLWRCGGPPCVRSIPAYAGEPGPGADGH